MFNMKFMKAEFIILFLILGINTAVKEMYGADENPRKEFRIQNKEFKPVFWSQMQIHIHSKPVEIKKTTETTQEKGNLTYNIDIVVVNYELDADTYLFLKKMKLLTCKFNFSKKAKHNNLTHKDITNLLDTPESHISCSNYVANQDSLFLPVVSNNKYERLQHLLKHTSLIFDLRINNYCNDNYSHPYSRGRHLLVDKDHNDSEHTFKDNPFTIQIHRLAYNVSNFSTQLNTEEASIYNKFISLGTKEYKSVNPPQTLCQAPLVGTKKILFTWLQHTFLDKNVLNKKEQSKFLETNKSGKPMKVYFDGKLVDLKDKKGKRKNSTKMIVILVVSIVVGTLLVVIPLVYFVFFRKQKEIEDYCSN